MKHFDIAKYVVWVAMKADIGVSPTKLQLVMFFVFKDYLERTGELLFDQTTFTVDTRCPRILDIWDKYRSYGGANIFPEEMNELSLSNRNLLNRLIVNYCGLTVEDLVVSSMELLGNPSPNSAFTTEELARRWRSNARNLSHSIGRTSSSNGEIVGTKMAWECERQYDE